MKNRNALFTSILLTLACFGLSPVALAVSPPPDGGYAGGNTAEGDGALNSFSPHIRGYGVDNTALGYHTLYTLTTGFDNTAAGYSALSSNNGQGNSAFGSLALFSNTSGDGNTALGAGALYSNTSGDANTAIGYAALSENDTGEGNTALGGAVLFFNNGDFNTAVGLGALFMNDNGDFNTATGHDALRNNNSGTDNTANGRQALFTNTTGVANTAIGEGALYLNDSGDFNTALGSGALFSNTSGRGNIALGASAGGGIYTADNVVAIGAVGENVSNSCYIGNIFEQTAAEGIQVFINSNNKLGTATSSKRFKEGIKPIGKASEALFSLKPISFRYKKEIDSTGRSQFGLVAEDVERVSPELVVRDKEGKPYTVRYDQVNTMLLNEFLKQHKKVEQLEKQVEALTAGLQKVSAQLELGKAAPQTALNTQ